MTDGERLDRSGIMTADRAGAIRRSVEAWARGLINIDARNTLLNFRDSKAGSLSFVGANPVAVKALLTGTKTPVSRLFAEREQRVDACTRIRNIHRKIVALEEEQGIEAGHVAHGLLILNEQPGRQVRQSLRLRAPLLLRRVEVTSRNSAGDDYALEADEDVEANPVLLFALQQEFGLDIDIDKFGEKLGAAVAELTEPASQLETVHQLLDEVCQLRGISFEIDPQVALGIFSYAKLPMVSDLKGSLDLLAEHDIVSALAGHAPAGAELLAHRLAQQEAVTAAGADQTRPQDEFLVCDADSSQQNAVNAALGGANLVIEGPPGTGKSQTIANIIACAAARGLRVLFVAEKRAAIEAVTSRLELVDLGDLVFDLHHQKLNKRTVAAKLGASLDRASMESPPRPGDLFERLTRARFDLIDHSDNLHERRLPWGISIFEVQSRLLELPKDHNNRVRFSGRVLGWLAGETLDAVRRDLQKFVELGGPRVRRGESPWSSAEVRSDDDVRRVLLELDELTGRTWQASRDDMSRLVGQTGLAQPTNVAGWQELMNLFEGVASSIRILGDTVFGPQLDELYLACGSRAWRRRQRDAPLQPWRRRRALRKQAKSMSGNRLTRPGMHDALGQAVRWRDQWVRLSAGRSTPIQVLDIESVGQRFLKLRNQLASVAQCARLADVESQPADDVRDRLDLLGQDRKTVFNLPELRRITDRLTGAGLQPLLDAITRQDVDREQAAVLLEYSWLSSLMDELRIQVPALREFHSERQVARVREFGQLDTQHRRLAPRRVRYSVARALRQARDEHPEQARIVTKEANKKTRHKSLRWLVDNAPDVLLALHPCWAMSPLVVSQTLPARRLFDLVVFDEASQIEPHEAITSIMRGERLIVAGDDQQLPPTRFFDRAVSAQEDQNDDDTDEDLADYESVLKVLKSFLPTCTLRWHYRSQDERLIEFSNATFYGNHLVTFPGVTEQSPVALDVVPGVAGPGKGSPPEEVRHVVQRILEHAEHRPNESLGVITMGTAHRDRIDHELRRARQERTEFDEFFSPEKGPNARFFVKNLEQVQGDERDRIILSLGKAKSPNGTLNRNFGALNQDGGSRRLNVAVTRARRDLLVVSSFTAADIGVQSNEGVEALRRYLEFAAVGGDLSRVGHAVDQSLNGFEQSVLNALNESGLKPVPQWGVSGYRIDFVIPHRNQPGRMVLAVETDGDSYHRCASVRDRDRLRQEHLERLGWRFHRVWCSAWFQDPERETERIVAAWTEAMVHADNPKPPPTSTDPIRRPPTTPGQRLRRGPRPHIPQYANVIDYSDHELRSLCRWLISDGLQIDRQNRLREALEQLPFGRLGKVIRQRLDAAFDSVQAEVDRKEI